jgi:hypothetical protein
MFARNHSTPCITLRFTVSSCIKPLNLYKIITMPVPVNHTSKHTTKLIVKCRKYVAVWNNKEWHVRKTIEVDNDNGYLVTFLRPSQENQENPLYKWPSNDDELWLQPLDLLHLWRTRIRKGWQEWQKLRFSAKRSWISFTVDESYVTKLPVDINSLANSLLHLFSVNEHSFTLFHFWKLRYSKM